MEYMASTVDAIPRPAATEATALLMEQQPEFAGTVPDLPLEDPLEVEGDHFSDEEGGAGDDDMPDDCEDEAGF
jgi:hypothetical protein